MARQTSQTPDDNLDESNDPRTIFIGRERQIDDFKTFLARWQERMARMGPDDMPEPAVPTPNNKIQGLVVMLFGRGGFGKSTLLRRYRNIVLNTNEQGSKIHIGGIVDWEFAIEGKRGLFNPPKGQTVDPVEYCKALANELAPKLDRKPDDCKHLQRALQDVGNAQKEVHRTLETMQMDDRYGWLRGLAIEGVTTLIRAHVPASVPILADPTVKNATDEAAKLTQEQLTHLLARLRDRLNKDALNDYLNPGARLGLALGADLRDWARNYPLLIFFDTYEEIDEGDALLRIVMSAAGPRVGCVMAGRDNLWGGADQIERSVAMEYGYKDLVPSDRGLSVNFNASDVGAFSPADITVYFALLQEKIPEAASLLPLTDDDAKRIWDVTQGVPLAVNIAAAIYRESKSLDAVTEKVEGKKEIVDQMVRRYLLHTRSNLNERYKLYGLAMLRRADQPPAIAAALGLSEDEAKTSYRSELSYLHRRYSFIFTEKDIPALHQEVRHFLRLWLLERRNEPEIVAVNTRLLAAQETAFRALEEQREYATLKERLQDDEWVDAYLDLTEQQFWADPVEGVKYILPFMIAAAIYRREASEEAAEIGEFFEAHISFPYSEWWEWTDDSLVYDDSHKPLPEELYGLKQLEKLLMQRNIGFPSIFLSFNDELKAALWWRLGEAYDDKDNIKALEWYEKALVVLEQEKDLREAAARSYYNVAFHDGIKEEKYAEDIELLTRAIELKPDYEDAYVNRGLIYNGFKLYKKSINDLNYAIALDPKHGLAYNIRGIVYWRLKEYEQAITDFTQYIVLEPKNADAYLNRGWVYEELKEYERAIADYTETIDLDPNDTHAYFSRGWVYRELKEYERALADFTQDIVLDPSNARAYFNRGRIYLELKEYERAIAEYTKGIAIDPNNAPAYIICGVAYANLEKYERAIADYTQAIVLDPNDTFAYYSRGNAYSDLKEYEQAIADYTQTIALDPKYAKAYYNRGNAYKNLKQFELTIADCTQVITLDPNYVTAYNNRGIAYKNLKQFELALADYTQAIALNPNYAFVYNNRGWVYDELKQFEQAIADYTQAIALDPSYVTAYNNRGNAYFELKQFEEALADYTQTITLDPQSASSYGRRAITHLFLHNSIKALADLENFCQLDPKDINGVWLLLWSNMGKQRPKIEVAAQLESIAEIDTEHYVAYVCRGLAMGLRGEVLKGLREIEKAILMEPEACDHYFWKGMLCAYYYRGRYERTMEAIEKALELEYPLPPILLTPLYWLEADRPDFFEGYAKPLLERYGM